MRLIASIAVGIFASTLIFNVINGLAVMVAIGFYLLSLVVLPKPKRTVRLYDND